MTANVDVLLARLEGVQKSGNGWRARCPGCAGRSRKLSVGVSDDGRILLHCFGGCDAAVVVQAAGLTIADLFPERLAADTPEERRRRQRLARESQWGAALEVVQHEARVVAIAAADIVNGRPLSPEDAARIAHAAARIAEAEAVLTDRPTQRLRIALHAAAERFAGATA